MKILIIKLFSIGDVLLSSALIKNLKHQIKDTEITYLVGNYSKQILENNPNIDKIIPVDDNILLKAKIIKILKLIYELRKEKFDLVFVLHRALLVQLFAYLICKNIITFKINKLINLLIYKFLRFKVVDDEKNKHELEKFLSLAKAINISPIPNPKLEIFLTDKEKEYAKKFLEKNKLKIVIAIGGGKNPKTVFSEKTLPPQKYKELIEKLINKYNCKIIMIGDKYDNEIAPKIQDKDIINLCGKTTIRELISVINICDLFIGVDSGPMHICAALNKPTIALFGPTNPVVWGPYCDNKVIIKSNVECSPCYKDNGKFPKCENNKCMKEININDILLAIDKLKI